MGGFMRQGTNGRRQQVHGMRGCPLAYAVIACLVVTASLASYWLGVHHSVAVPTAKQEDEVRTLPLSDITATIGGFAGGCTAHWWSSRGCCWTTMH